MGTLENRRKLTAVRGMGAALVGFAGWIVLYVVFGLIEPNIFTTNNMLNLLRSMAKYLLVGVGQGVILITGNIDLSIGSVVAMSAMISATMMSHGTAAIVAVCAAIVCCLAVGVINGLLVGKFKLPPFIATLGTMFCARGVAYLANGNRNTDAIVTGLGKEAGDAFQNFFYYGKTLGIYNAFWIAFVIFAVASITDFFDGMLARKNNWITSFGKFADPIADKMLVNTVLILMVYFHQANVIAVLLMIARDLIVDGLRMSAANSGEVVSAGIFGKLKTVLQMFALVFLLLKDWPFVYMGICMDQILLWAATVASLYSGLIYFNQLKKYVLETM